MNCSFSKETLALHVENDLPATEAEIASNHLAACEECRRYYEELGDRLAILKSLKRRTVTPSECAGMRRDVMSIVNDPRRVSGWMLAIERGFMLGVRKRVYVCAAIAILVIVSASLVGQMRHAATADAGETAHFDSTDSLLRPQDYRDWIFAGASLTPHHSAMEGTRNIYINPSAYSEYAKTGSFPEGTVMVLEAVGRNLRTPALLVSVKDRTRFDGGWGFFDFTGNDGAIKSWARALPESSGCRSCHEQRALSGHAFKLPMRRPPALPADFI